MVAWTALIWVPALAIIAGIVVPSVLRNGIRAARMWYVQYFMPPLPPRAVKIWSADVVSMFFAGNAADARQAMHPYGLFPNSARVLHNPAQGVLIDHEPADIIPTPLGRVYAWWRINLGQEDDVTLALRHTRSVLASNPGKRLVLFGSSRGAAVLIQVAARLTPAEIARIPMIICEAPFTTVDNVIETRFADHPVIQAAVRAALSTFTRYRPENSDRWSPTTAARSFPHKELPIVLVRSRVDTVVVPALTTQIGSLLRIAGVRSVHEIVLNVSDHSSFTSANDADRRIYVDALNALYAQYHVLA